MTQQQIDSNTLRAERRALARGSLLVIAERVNALLSQEQLSALLGDIVQINVAPGGAGLHAQSRNLEFTVPRLLTMGTRQ